MGNPLCKYLCIISEYFDGVFFGCLMCMYLHVYFCIKDFLLSSHLIIYDLFKLVWQSVVSNVNRGEGISWYWHHLTKEFNIQTCSWKLWTWDTDVQGCSQSRVHPFFRHPKIWVNYGKDRNWTHIITQNE